LIPKSVQISIDAVAVMSIPPWQDPTSIQTISNGVTESPLHKTCRFTVRHQGLVRRTRATGGRERQTQRFFRKVGVDCVMETLM
jgi:hypothetical protein